MQALMMIRPSQGTDQTEVRKVEDPQPGPGEVTIDVAYAGINFMDVMARRGDPGYASGWPYTPGLEVSGSVREVGPGFTTLAVGQRVVAFTPGGGLAEVARTRAEFAVPLPDQVPLPVAAAAPLNLTTALLLLTDAARFRPGDSVLVHSASGGVGSAIAQLVPALGGGLRIGTVGRPDKVAAALASGYDAECVRVRQDLAIAESQFRDYQARLGKPFAHELYLAELTGLRDQLKAGLSATAPVEGDAAKPTVSELAEKIKTLKAAHSIEAMPQRVRQKQSSAEEPVTARIRRRAEASYEFASVTPPAVADMSFRQRIATERQNSQDQGIHL